MMIQILHAAFVYQSPDGEVEALRDVSFDVQEGEFCRFEIYSLFVEVLHHFFT